MTSSVILCYSSNLDWHAILSFFQCSYSLLMLSMSSVTKSMLLPRGFVDWHKIYIAFFMNSISFSLNPPPISLVFLSGTCCFSLTACLVKAYCYSWAGFFLALPIFPILISGPLFYWDLAACSSSPSSFICLRISCTTAPCFWPGSTFICIR